jgi:hypothetical protein
MTKLSTLHLANYSPNDFSSSSFSVTFEHHITMNRYGGRESFSEKRYLRACKELCIRPLPYLLDVFRFGLASVRLERVLHEPQAEEEIAEGEGIEERGSHECVLGQESADGEMTNEEEKHVISLLWVLRTDIILRYVSFAHTRFPQRIWKVIADVLGDPTQGQIVNRGIVAVDLSNCRLSDSQTSLIGIFTFFTLFTFFTFFHLIHLLHSSMTQSLRSLGILGSK